MSRYGEKPSGKRTIRQKKRRVHRRWGFCVEPTCDGQSVATHGRSVNTSKCVRAMHVNIRKNNNCTFILDGYQLRINYQDNVDDDI